MTEDRFFFVVDTNQYAGNFERAMTAFCTGIIGDCGVGEQQAEDMRAAYPAMHKLFGDVIAQLPDAHGCSRPCQLVATPGYWSDGLGHHWPEAMRGASLPKRVYAQAAAQLLPSASQPAQHGYFPAYLSVGISLSSQPSASVVAFLCERARLYAMQNGLVVTGFRLMQRVTTEQLVAGYPADWRKE